MKDTPWFESWFDSPYYHLLYDHRDDSEAELFIGTLVDKLQISSNKRVLDLACGKGRHSLVFNTLGHEVMGVDLSNNSIKHAQAFATDTLQFRVHDMREPVPDQYFGLICNLFTSFGYFDTITDNAKTIQAISSMLEPDGRLILDYMNCTKVVRTLDTSLHVVEKNGVTFETQKKQDHSFIYKHIDIKDPKGKPAEMSFREKVQIIYKSDFEKMMISAGLQIFSVYGDYSLAPYDEEDSDRLIIVAQLS